MNYLVFADDKRVPCVWVEEHPVYHEGANRRALTIHLEPGAIGLDELDALLLNKQKTQRLRHVNDEVKGQDIFTNYTDKVELGKRPTAVGVDEAGNELTAERIIFTLARKSAAEIAAEETRAELDAVKEALRAAKLMK